MAGKSRYHPTLMEVFVAGKIKELWLDLNGGHSDLPWSIVRG
jgi:hypothetical protein